MRATQWIGTGIAIAAIGLGGCASEPSQPYGTTSSYPGPYDSRNYPGTYDNRTASYTQGVVDRIEVINKGSGNNIAGTIIGGIAGGLIGHQIGSGRGNTAATIAGAAGGAVAGNEIQKRQRGTNETFRVTVRMDDGSTQVVNQEDIRDLHTGDRVRVENNRIYRL